MGYWAAIGSAAAGLFSSYMSSKNKATSLPQNYYNIYGQVNTPNTGAISSMQSVFDRINSPSLQQNVTDASNQYAGAIRSAAANPGLASIYNYGLRELNGDYLNSPLVQNYANQAYAGELAGGADAAAQTRARFGRAGIGFSTANQQAQQADMATAAQRAAAMRAGILANNYQSERQLQNKAPEVVSNAISQPLSYLSQLPSAYYTPLQFQSAITQQLAGGQGASTPTYLQQPTTADTVSSGLQNALAIYSLYKGAKGGSGSSSSGGGDVGNV